MSNSENLEVFRRWIAAHRAHDIDQMLTMVSENITIQSAAGASMPPAQGKVEARHHWQTIFTTFPDMRMEELDTVSDATTIFAEISHGGTMLGSMGPHDPTGNEYRTNGAFRIDFVDGQIASVLSYWDTGAMMRQLALTP
jgi:predicted ester cyclase